MFFLPAAPQGRVQIQQYMTKQCRAPGCSGAATGFSTWCDHHKQTQRRHGDPRQVGLTVHELRPYVALVEARKAKNADSPAWGILEARWGHVVEGCRETLRRFAGGAVGNRVARLAAHQLVTVADNTEPWIVVRTVLAMYLMADQQPRRFATDAAFDFQLVRRVRGLAPVNAGTYWDQKEGRNRRVYRDVPPRVIQSMAQPLKEALGAAGLSLATKERQDVERAVDERRRLASALEDLA